MRKTTAPFRVPSISDRDFWNGLGGQPHLVGLLEHVEKLVGGAAAQPGMPYASDYLAANRFNDRARIDRLWQQGRAVLSALTANRCITGLEANDADDRLLDWLWAFLTHSTWTVSAHLPNRDLPPGGRPVLDLASCEMAAVMAEMREALKPWMDSVSGTLADTVIYEIDRRILTPYAEGFEVWWDKRDRLNNWLGVCAGNILAACESLAAQGQPRPVARKRTMAGLRLFFDEAFTEHGECDEGLGYWGYGVGQAVVGLSRLTREELVATVDMRRLRQVADYPRRIHLCGDVFYSGNDAVLHVRAPSFLPWLAEVTELPWLAAWAASRSTIDGRSFPMMMRGLVGPEMATIKQSTGGQAASGTQSSPATNIEARSERCEYLADQQVAILQKATPRGKLIVCLGGGHNGERHNHNDVGHFLVTLDDQVIVPDIGSPSYAADFFGPKRYTYLAASSRGHNCPLIDGIEQRTGAEAAGTVVEWVDRPGQEKLVLDLAAAYPAEAKLAKWTRSLRRDGEGFVIRDEYRARPGARITHVIWSTEAVSLGGAAAGKQVVRMGPSSCALEPAPADVRVEEVDPQAHRLREHNKTLYRVAAEYVADSMGELTVESRFWVA